MTVFTVRVGEPLSVALVATALFYVYAIWRRVAFATEALTAMLLLLAFVGPDTLDTHQFTGPQSTPLLAAALLQLVLGLDWRNAWRCLVGMGLLIAAVLALPEDAQEMYPIGAIAFHLAVCAGLMIGALFHNALAYVLRALASVLCVLANLAVLFGRVEVPANVPAEVLLIYPLALSALLAAYGRLLDQRIPLAASAVILAGWLSLAGWRGYCWLRQIVLGLDHLLLSLALFAVAVLVSLIKAGARLSWLTGRLSMNRQR